MKDLKEQLKSGLPKSEAQQLRQMMLKEPALFAGIMGIFLEGPSRSSQIAAGEISSCVKKDPELLFPFLAPMLTQLKAPDVKDATKRNILRILQFVPIPQEHEGEILEFCFQYLADSKEAVAIKVFSMSILYHLSQKYPDLQNELKVLIQDQLPYSSPAFISRGSKILKALKS